MIGVALLLLQTSAWTVTPPVYSVGDTVVVERVVPLADPAMRLRVPDLPGDDTYLPLRPPRIEYTAEGAVVRFVLAPFDPRGASIEMPALERLLPDGTVESLPGGTVQLAPRSVLEMPPGDTLPDPRYSRAPIPRPLRQTQPVAALGLVVTVVVVLWGVNRRRVGLRPEWKPVSADATPPITDWIQAGEPRAVAALVMTGLRAELARRVPEATEALSVEQCLEVVASERPHWPLPELRSVLGTLERAAFAPAVPADVLLVVDEASDLRRAIDAADREAASDEPDVEEPSEG